MKTVLLVLTALVFSFAPTSVNAQNTQEVRKMKSLAEKTGETRSLYNAICKYNRITPGDATMDEFRAMAVKYCLEVGCTNYELYLYNGGNNLYILYYEPVFKDRLQRRMELNRRLQEEPIHLDRSYRNTPSTDCSGCEVTVVNVDTTVIVSYEINEVAPLQVTSILNDVKVDTVVSPKAPTDYICDCRGKDSDQLNNYYTQMLKARRSTPKGQLKDSFGECAYQIRMYKQQIERDEADERLLQRVQERVDKAVEEKSARLASSEVALKSKNTKKKKRKVRKVRKPRGAKKTRGKSYTFLSRLFPFINC